MSNFSSKNSYNLILQEKEGSRTIRMIIGVAEAQAITIASENIKTIRPTSHELFYSMMIEFQLSVTKVVLYNYFEGVFKAFIYVVNKYGEEVPFDARPSDAIALAVRFEVGLECVEEIFEHFESIQSKQTTSLNQSIEIKKETPLLPIDLDFSTLSQEERLARFSRMSQDELVILLKNAVDEENYVLAQMIKDFLDQKNNT
jgi:hypothetical protein